MESTAFTPESGKETLDIHGDAVGAALINAGFDDIAHLTADLDAILARRPSSAAGHVVWMQPLPARLPAAEKLNPLHDGAAEKSDADFTWFEGSTELGELQGRDTTIADAALRWVKKARRQRLKSRFRAVASWLITVLLGGAIVGASMYVMLGRLPDFNDVLALGQRVWM